MKYLSFIVEGRFGMGKKGEEIEIENILDFLEEDEIEVERGILEKEGKVYIMGDDGIECVICNDEYSWGEVYEFFNKSLLENYGEEVVEDFEDLVEVIKVSEEDSLISLFVCGINVEIDGKCGNGWKLKVENGEVVKRIMN